MPEARAEFEDLGLVLGLAALSLVAGCSDLAEADFLLLQLLLH